MLQVTKMTVRSFDLDHLDLYWEIANLPFGDSDQHAIYDYAFYILRAGDSPLGPYEQVGGPLSDTYHFRDADVSLHHRWRQYHYKLKIVHLPTGEEAMVGPTTFEAEEDLIATEINRLEDMLFREFVGRRCWLFPARTFGPLCSCFDKTLNRMTRSNHPTCFGTGFLGGYMSPVEVFVQIDPNPKSFSATSLQEVQQNDSLARMISFPPVSPRDILVETENRRWRLLAVTTTQRLRAVVRQELKIHEIPRGDVEYELPIRVDQKNLVPSAERNFTNPQNLESDGDYSDILAAYGHPRGVSF